MNRTQEWWDRYFLGIAKYVATASKDPSVGVGAILVDPSKHVVGTGYNGFPPGIEDTPERLNDRETKYKLIVHAEVNAILQAGTRAKDCTIYVYPSFGVPAICSDCCKTAIAAGVAGLVCYNPSNPDRVGRWQESIKLSRDMWLEAGKFIRSYDE